MGNFMSCVLICGAMEVVQVVNTNGRVEKLIRPVRAAEIIWAHERYNAAAAGAPPPDEKQQQPKPRPTSSGKREEKFVLVPLGDDGGRKPGIGEDNASSRTRGKSSFSDVAVATAASAVAAPQQGHSQPFKVKKEGGVTTLIVSKRYLEQLLAEKTPASTGTKLKEDSSSSRCSRKPSSSSSSAKRPSIWRPALESISESISASSSSGSSSSSNSGSSGGRSGSGHSQSKQQHQHQHRRHRHEQQQQQQQGLVKF